MIPDDDGSIYFTRTKDTTHTLLTTNDHGPNYDGRTKRYTHHEKNATCEVDLKEITYHSKTILCIPKRAQGMGRRKTTTGFVLR